MGYGMGNPEGRRVGDPVTLAIVVTRKQYDRLEAMSRAQDPRDTPPVARRVEAQVEGLVEQAVYAYQREAEREAMKPVSQSHEVHGLSDRLDTVEQRLGTFVATGITHEASSARRAEAQRLERDVLVEAIARLEALEAHVASVQQQEKGLWAAIEALRQRVVPDHVGRRLRGLEERLERLEARVERRVGDLEDSVLRQRAGG